MGRPSIASCHTVLWSGQEERQKHSVFSSLLILMISFQMFVLLWLVKLEIASNKKCPVMAKCQAALTMGSAASFSYDVCDALPSGTVNGPTLLDLCGNQLHEQPYRLLPEINMKNTLWDSP